MRTGSSPPPRRPAEAARPSAVPATGPAPAPPGPRRSAGACQPRRSGEQGACQPPELMRLDGGQAIKSPFFQDEAQVVDDRGRVRRSIKL